MRIRNQNVDPKAQVGRERIAVPLITALSQAGVVCYKLTPLHKFQIVSVKTYCLTKAGTVSGNLKVGGRVAAPLVFTAATEVAGVLSTTLANLRGSEAEAITIEYTTDGSGVLTNGSITIEYRPRPMAGDLGPV